MTIKRMLQECIPYRFNTAMNMEKLNSKQLVWVGNGAILEILFKMNNMHHMMFSQVVAHRASDPEHPSKSNRIYSIPIRMSANYSIWAAPQMARKLTCPLISIEEQVIVGQQLIALCLTRETATALAVDVDWMQGLYSLGQTWNLTPTNYQIIKDTFQEDQECCPIQMMINRGLQLDQGTMKFNLEK